MTNSPRKPQDFFKEVWRRQVLQIVVPYAIAGWLLAQVAELVLDAFEMPPWVMQALLVVLLLGFPVVVVLAWIFDITPKGHFVRTEPSEGSDETEHPPAISLEMGDSERRQVTMLSCRFDITRGDSREIDLEYQRDAILALDKVSRDLARRFDAYLIPAITEQFSFVFGYPQAHDDDARRAVAAGLAIMEEVGKLQKTRADLADLEVTAHVGIHTGLVVIDDSEADKQKVTITGQVQSFTDWLRNVAPANTVVISPQTHQLTDSFYETESLGDYPHPRHQEQVAVFRVHKPFPTSDDLWQKQKLVGRDHELLLLEGHWDNVVNGGGQFALIQGKPGIGKSALVRSFSQQVTMRSKVWVMPCYCSPYEQNNAMFPITQALQGPILGFTPSETVQVRFEKLSAFVDEKKLDAEDALSLLSGLLSLPVASESSPPEPPQITRIRTLELLLTLIRSTATQQPVLMIFEDLQWADPTTLEMIEMMVDEGPSPGVFLLFSARPEFAADWSRRSFVLNLDLSPLANSASRELIASSAGAFEMPSELVERIVEETEGNPLYIQELTRGLLESDAARNSFGQGLAGRLEIPATLLDSLAARIDSLGKAKSVLQLCSVLGHEFSYDLLRSVSQSENEVALKEYLAGLVKAEMLFQRDSFRHRSYVFKHILIQESAYNSLLKSTRKELHDKTATVMEERYPEMANLQPARLAYHFTRAGKADKAIAYWTGAAAQSLARFANAEAIEQARQGLGLLEETPVSPQRVEQELPLQGVLGKAFFALHGYSSRRGRRAFERALELCELIGDAPQLFQMLDGLWMYYVISARFEASLEIAQRLLRIAETTQDPAQLLQAHYCMGYTKYYKADYSTAQKHLQFALDSEQKGCDYASQSATEDDRRMPVRVMLALVDWHLGLPATAARHVREANDMARELKHPFGITFAAFVSAWFHQMRLDPVPTAKYAELAAGIAEKKGFGFWLPLSQFMLAWAENHNAVSGPPSAAGVEKMNSCGAAYVESGAGAGQTYLWSKLAEEYIALDMPERALEILERVNNAIESTGELFFAPEYHRLRGLLCLQQNRDRAEEYFKQALSQARGSNSLALELRATMDLAELMLLDGRNEEGIQLLSGVCERFAEFDDSGDCVRALDLLKKLKKKIR